MPQHRCHDVEPSTVSSEPGEAPRPGSGDRQAPQRVDLVSDSPAARIQRLLVLAGRFRSSVALRSDPARQVDLLRRIISLARETFGTRLPRDWAARTTVQMAPDQLQCLRDLERLLQGLAHGSPDAWRGLGHAMDALLIQCLLFDTAASETTELTDP